MDRTIPDRYVAAIEAIAELNRQASAALEAGDMARHDRVLELAARGSHMLVTEMAGYLAVAPVA
jgi:hypothetical protein